MPQVNRNMEVQASLESWKANHHFLFIFLPSLLPTTTKKFLHCGIVVNNFNDNYNNLNNSSNYNNDNNMNSSGKGKGNGKGHTSHQNTILLFHFFSLCDSPSGPALESEAFFMI